MSFYYTCFANSIDRIVAYYSFESSTIDIANNNNLENYNATLTEGPFVKENSAYFFNGINSYLSIDDSSQTGLDITDDFTIVILFKMDNHPTDDTFTFINKGKPDGENGGYGFDYANINGHNRLRVYWYAPQKFSRIYTDIDLCLNQWYHIIVSTDIQLGQANFYINGKYYEGIIENNDAITIINNNEEFRVGSFGKDSYGADAKRYFNGSIAEIRLYNRQLINDEIDKHWFSYCQFELEKNIEEAVYVKQKIIDELETKISQMYTKEQFDEAIINAQQGLYTQQQVDVMINKILEWDTNNDGAIGLIEAIHALQLSTGVKLFQ